MANLNASAQALSNYNSAAAALQAAAGERYRGFEGLSRFGEALLSYGIHRQKQTAAESMQNADFNFKEAYQKRQHTHELNLLRQQGKNAVSEKNALLAAWQAQENDKKEVSKPLVDVTKDVAKSEAKETGARLPTHDESGKPIPVLQNQRPTTAKPKSSLKNDPFAPLHTRF